jgi:hypothetical protein
MPSKPYPHPEERPKGASRRTQARCAALRPKSCPASQRNPSFLQAEAIVMGFVVLGPSYSGSACELNFNAYERFCCRFAAGAAEDWLLEQLLIVVSRRGFSGACSIPRRGIGSGDNRSLISKEDLYSHVFPRARFLRQRGTGRCPRDVLGLAMGFRFDDNLRLASQTIKN